METGHRTKKYADVRNVQVHCSPSYPGVQYETWLTGHSDHSVQQQIQNPFLMLHDMVSWLFFFNEGGAETCVTCDLVLASPLSLLCQLG